MVMMATTVNARRGRGEASPAVDMKRGGVAVVVVPRRA